jgi:hypothetical protein
MALPRAHAPAHVLKCVSRHGGVRNKRELASPRDPVASEGTPPMLLRARGHHVPATTSHSPRDVILIPSLAAPEPCDEVGGSVAWRVINAAPSRHRLLPPTFSSPNPPARQVCRRGGRTRQRDRAARGLGTGEDEETPK